MKLSCIDAIVPGETLKDKSENLEGYEFEGVDIRTGSEDLGQREKEIAEIASRSNVKTFLSIYADTFLMQLQSTLHKK